MCLNAPQKKWRVLQHPQHSHVQCLRQAEWDAAQLSRDFIYFVHRLGFVFFLPPVTLMMHLPTSFLNGNLRMERQTIYKIL